MFLWLSSVKARIITGFCLLVVTLVAVTAVSGWQEHVHRSDLARLEAQSKVTSELQRAEAQAAIAALLLQRFVITGDPALRQEIEEHATAAVVA